jgi:hypothetical protein
LNYDWQGKYFVNATFRRDGSSRFGPNNRFGNFGALGLPGYSHRRILPKVSQL